MVALPAGAARRGAAPARRRPRGPAARARPHPVRLPRRGRRTRRAQFAYTWENMTGGLDGIAIDLPALNVKPTHGALLPAATSR